MVTFLVFSQHPADGVPLLELGRHATRFFDATVESLLTPMESSAHPGRPASATVLRCEVIQTPPPVGDVLVAFSSFGARSVFAITKRATTTEDVSRARDAEVRMHTAGLAGLAARCAWIFVVVPEAAAIEWMAWECSALVASVSLGPVLSSDGATLVGVKSARARAEALRLAATR